MIFCTKCNYVGLPLTVNPTVKNNKTCEVCPVCKSIKHAQYFVDAAAAHHAQAKLNQEATKCI